jgi:hypothetical protein
MAVEKGNIPSTSPRDAAFGLFCYIARTSDNSYVKGIGVVNKSECKEILSIRCTVKSRYSGLFPYFIIRFPSCDNRFLQVVSRPSRRRKYRHRNHLNILLSRGTEPIWDPWFGFKMMITDIDILIAIFTINKSNLRQTICIYRTMHTFQCLAHHRH